MKKLFLTLSVLALFSCSQETVMETNEAPDTRLLPQEESWLIDKNAVSLTSDDARNVAMRFASDGTDTRASSGSPSVETVYDHSLGIPLVHVVNFGDDNGYVIVSATKKESPVLAYSETGHYEIDCPYTTDDYLEMYKSRIKAASLDTSDSLRAMHALEWAVFEKADTEESLTRGTSDINQMIQAEINRKTAMGYTYIGKLSAAASYLSPENYQSLVKDISSHTDPDYNYNDVTLFFIRSSATDKIGPLMGTQWDQEYPFNVDAPNGYAGCVPIAVAQIVYYHKYPSKYSWNQIYTYPVLNDAFEYFIKDIRQLCKVTYNSGGTASDYNKAYDAFTALGYQASKDGVPDDTKLKNAISLKNPVFIVGDNTSVGHAWVCEGSQSMIYSGSISMVIDSPYGMPDTPGSPYFSYNVNLDWPSMYTGYYFYMNMGWGGINNGWYRANCYNGSDPDSNYLNNQKIITIKK